MIKHGRVTAKTPSVVSGRRGTKIEQGESIQAGEQLPEVYRRPLEKNAAVLGTKPIYEVE